MRKLDRKVVHIQEKLDRRTAKKQEKLERLRTAMEELSVEQGADQTAIDDIVRRAGVAKGTFYNYFDDKADIIEDIVAGRSRAILKQALERIKARALPTPVDQILCFVEEIIEIMRKNRHALELICKNLTWGLCRRLTAEADTDETLREIKEGFLGLMRAQGSSQERDPEQILFLLVELISSVCYSAIVHREPAGMDEMKPLLMDSVRRIVT